MLPLSTHAAGLPLIVCFGDSITAGFGVEAGHAYPDALWRNLSQAGYHYNVVNQGLNGATTKDAVALLPAILALHPQVVIIEFGGNDGLRGLPLERTQQNLDRVITELGAAHVKVLLVGITLPPNYGVEYTAQFEAIFHDLAMKHHTAFVPMLYKNLIGVNGALQPDAIHPTAKGAEIIAQTLLPMLKPLLTGVASENEKIAR